MVATQPGKGVNINSNTSWYIFMVFLNIEYNFV